MGAPRISFKTLGCRMNKAETAQMAAHFSAAGYEVVAFGAPCEVAVIHSCTVTRHADKTSIRLARAARRMAGKPMVIVTGCAARLSPDAVLRESGADLVLPADPVESLPGIVNARRAGMAAASPSAPPTAALSPRFSTARAWVKVQEGCDFGCAYCVVPLARGPSRSRSFAEILDEIERLADSGYKEIVLTGTNVGCYADNGRGLVSLLAAVERIQNVRRIRLSSIELTTGEKPIVDFMASSSKLCRFLHVPLQSGDDRLLSAMGRRHNVSEYARFIAYAIERVGIIGLGADVITGLPGEDGESFERTFKLVESLPFSNLHVFTYSPRAGTAAAGMSGQVSEVQKKERSRRLIELGRIKRREFAMSLIGRPVSVLIEQVDNHALGTGWTNEYVKARVALPPSARANDIIEFHPVSWDGIALAGANSLSHT